MYKVHHGRITGIPNKEFTPEDAAYLGAVIGSWYGRGSVAVSGRDYNPSSRMLKRAFISGLMSVGVEVMDFHEAVAGEITYYIKRFGARGGFIVLDNPVLKDHTVFKIYANPGIEITGKSLSRIIEEKNIRRVEPYDTGWVSYSEYIHRLYVSALTSFITSNMIMGKKFRVVIDVNHGPADKIIPELFSHLNIDFVLINASRPPKTMIQVYPYTGSIRDVSGIVRSVGADIGLVMNNDASDLLVIDENGRPLLPEDLLLIYSRTAPAGGTIIYTDRCFLSIDDILLRKNMRIQKVKDDPMELLSKIREERPVVGMDCSGSVIHPLFSLGPDAILGTLKILEILAETSRKVSELVRMETHPRYYALETTVKPRELAEKICGDKHVECRVFIGGYRLRIHGSNVVITYDPIDDTTKILIDIKSPNINKVLETIHKNTKTWEI